MLTLLESLVVDGITVLVLVVAALLWELQARRADRRSNRELRLALRVFTWRDADEG